MQTTGTTEVTTTMEITPASEQTQDQNQVGTQTSSPAEIFALEIEEKPKKEENCCIQVIFFPVETTAAEMVMAESKHFSLVDGILYHWFQRQCKKPKGEFNLV